MACDLDHDAMIAEWAGKLLPVGGCECPSCGYRFEQPIGVPLDPDANLAEQERIIARRNEPGAPVRDMQAGLALERLRLELAKWLNAGGRAPDWRAAPRAARFYRIYQRS